MAKVTASLAWPKEFYTAKVSTLTKNLGVNSEEEIRQEYKRLRDIAQKRIKRLGEAFPESETYKYYKEAFKPLKELSKPGTVTSELAASLSEIADFLSSKRSSVTGQKQIRKDTLTTFHKHGYDFINESNFDDFTDFMDDLKSAHLKDIYDSDRILELYKVAEDKEIPKEELLKDFEFYLENRKNIAKIPKDDLSDLKSSKDYKKAINDFKKEESQKKKTASKVKKATKAKKG